MPDPEHGRQRRRPADSTDETARQRFLRYVAVVTGADQQPALVVDPTDPEPDVTATRQMLAVAAMPEPRR